MPYKNPAARRRRYKQRRLSDPEWVAKSRAYHRKYQKAWYRNIWPRSASTSEDGKENGGKSTRAYLARKRLFGAKRISKRLPSGTSDGGKAQQDEIGIANTEAGEEPNKRNLIAESAGETSNNRELADGDTIGRTETGYLRSADGSGLRALSFSEFWKGDATENTAFDGSLPKEIFRLDEQGLKGKSRQSSGNDF